MSCHPVIILHQRPEIQEQQKLCRGPKPSRLWTRMMLPERKSSWWTRMIHPAGRMIILTLTNSPANL
eukprot:1608035-Karenia_brevis.AAC.1